MNTTSGVWPLLLGSWCALACGGSAREGEASGGRSSASAGSGLAGAPGSVANGGAVGVSGASGRGGSETASGGSASVDLAACSADSECELVPANCCDGCPTTLEDFLAINAKYDAQYASRCETVDCNPPRCLPDFDSSTNYYIATCEAQRCVALDLRTTPLTSCTRDADCVLRGGTACCAGCGSRSRAPIVALAIGSEPALRGFVCGSAPKACPACTATFPDDSAVCGDDQVCRVLQRQ